MTKSKIFLYFCLSFIGGIFLSSIVHFSQLLMLGILILGILLLSVFWRYKKLVIIGFAILFLVLGIWRYQQIELGIANNELRKYNAKETVTLMGVISEESDVREKSLKLTIKVENIKGKILVTANRYPEYQYGDKLKITGKLESPPIFEGFNYRDYLKKDGIYSVMNFPEIELIGQGFGNPIIKALFSFKNKFKKIARSFVSPPQEGILEALVFGDEENISREWKNKLNFTGTRHITAVSGMNITIFSALLLNFLLLCGLWRSQAFYFSLILLTLYILMIGAPASAVRAGIMAGFFLTAQYFGRASFAPRAVLFAATFMLVKNPLLLRLDVGFQLSFLAILGIIYLMPIFRDYFLKSGLIEWFQKCWWLSWFPIKSIGDLLIMTIAAQIFTLPILIYNFGYIPLISPVANILIVPFLAPITILIFIFGILGMIFWGLGWILSWPTWLLLTYITKIIDWFFQIPRASLSLENVHWFWIGICYLILGLITWRLNERQKLKFLK